MAGFFNLKLVSVSSIVTRAGAAGSPGWQANGGVSDSDFLTALNDNLGVSNQTAHFNPGDPTAFISGSMGFSYSHSLPCISLDGGPLITFDDLPAGFTVISAQASISVSAGMVGANIAPAAICTINLLSGTFKVGSFLTDTVIPVSDSNNFAGGFGFNVSDSLTINYPDGTTISDMLSLGPQVNLSGSADLNGSSPNPPNRYWQATLGVDSLSVSGLYDIVLFQFQFSIDTEPPISVGQPITVSISELSPHPLPIADITQIRVQFTTLDNVDHEVIITNFKKFKDHFVFDAPDFGDAPIFHPIVDISGKPFTGSVPIGDLPTINFTDGTGIYKLVPGKTSDSVYIQDYDPVQIEEIKIPNPFFKTGFIP